jgi:hypothetical protein
VKFLLFTERYPTFPFRFKGVEVREVTSLLGMDSFGLTHIFELDFPLRKIIASEADASLPDTLHRQKEWLLDSFFLSLIERKRS